MDPELIDLTDADDDVGFTPHEEPCFSAPDQRISAHPSRLSLDENSEAELACSLSDRSSARESPVLVDVTSSFQLHNISSPYDLFQDEKDTVDVSPSYQLDSHLTETFASSNIVVTNGNAEDNASKNAQPSASERNLNRIAQTFSYPKDKLFMTQVLIDSRMEQATELSEKLKHLIYSGVIKALKDIDVEEFVKVCDLPFPGLIIFQRPASMLIDDLSSHRLTINREMDEQVLVVTPIARFISLVHSFVTGSLEATPDIEPKMNLAQFADELLATFLPKRIKLTFVVFNIDSYYKELKLLESAMVKNAITGKSENVTAKKYPILNSCRVTVNREQVMQATVRLQVTHRVTFIWPSSPAQLSEIILAFAKAISERQSRQKTHSFSFLPEGELAQGVRVDASGKGLREVWKRALLQCFGVSFQDGAEAIVRQYGCPDRLLQAYRACHNELEKQLLLANIKIRTKNNFSRRLGDVFSRKVYLAMTSKDPCLKIV